MRASFFFAPLVFFSLASAQFDDFFFRENLPWNVYSKQMVKPSMDLYIEDYYDFAIGNLNAIGGFTAADGESYAINGNPSRWMRYLDHGFDTSDHFFVGSSLHKLELNVEDVIFNRHHSLISTSNVFFGKDSRDHYFSFDGGHGGFIHDDLRTGVFLQELVLERENPHPIQREGANVEDLINSRRHTVEHIELIQNHRFVRPEGVLLLKNLNQYGRRNWLNFDHNGISGSYNEDYLRLNLQLIWLPKSLSSLEQFHLRYTHLERSHLFAENYHTQDETANIKMDNLSLWGNVKSLSYTGVHGINFSRKLIEKNEENFSRNVIDQDGTELEPWYPSLDIIELSQNNKSDYSLNLPFLDQAQVVGNFNQVFMHLRPLSQTNQSAVYYQNSETNLALYVRNTTSRPFSIYMLSAQAGFEIEKKFFKQFLHLKVGVSGVVDIMTVSGESLILPEIEYNVDLGLVSNKTFFTGIYLGRKSIPFGSELAMFISGDYDSGVFSYWNDVNSNLVLESGEDTGNIYRPTGGEYVELDPNLRHPNYFYFDIPIQFKIGKHFAFSTTISYKSYRNLFDVRWKENASSYGHYDTVTSNSAGTKSYDNHAEDQSIYVIDNGQSIRYVVSHDEDYPNLGNSIFTENPFYAGAYMEAVGKGKKWYASISFNAFMAMGRSGYGNGHLDNTLGSLSEENANPNSTIRSIGRLNNDQGYTAKIMASGELFKGFWGGILIKYRDGEPFSHYLTYITNAGNGNQVSAWKRNVNGDNLLFGGEFGTREDALWNVDLNFIYNLIVDDVSMRIYFQIMNAVDIASAILEKVFEPNRIPLELQNPRGFRTGVQIRF